LLTFISLGPGRFHTVTLHDPHGRSDTPYYECMDCRRRLTEEVQGRLCPDCGGYLKNLGVAREE
jgi:rRNA maturation endonuclease Nob1